MAAPCTAAIIGLLVCRMRTTCSYRWLTGLPNWCTRDRPANRHGTHSCTSSSPRVSVFKRSNDHADDFLAGGAVVNETDLIATFPRLYHAADRGAWPSIQRHGLLSTSALLDLYGIRGDGRLAFESQRRRTSTAVLKPGFPDVVLRDQSPMSDELLRRCLDDGMSPRQWFESLDGKVFFWTTKQ
jgi:hypothetical protein